MVLGEEGFVVRVYIVTMIVYFICGWGGRRTVQGKEWENGCLWGIGIK